MQYILKIKHLPFIIILLISVTSFGQQIMFRPLKYNEPNKQTNFQPVDAHERDNVSPWHVNAINENVTTTTTPGGTQRSKTLKFGDLFWVVEEQGIYIRIFKDARRDYNQLSANAEDYGWIRKEDVLLWPKALTDPVNQIPLKGIIMNTTKALEAGQDNFRRIRAYKDPDLRNPTNFEARLFEIFYIYKYDPGNNAVLLGRTPFITTARAQTHLESTGNIIGWVDINRVLEWDHRVALEPSWGNAVEERKRRNIRSSIFSPAADGAEESCAKQFSLGQHSAGCDIAWNDDLWVNNPSPVRKPGYWRRFPVVGDMGDNIYKIMVMGEMTGESGVIHEDVDIQVRQNLNEIIDKSRNINVVFAIDGTSSMGPFFQSVINSVQRIVQIFEASGELHKDLKFGYVVYRDYLERDRLLETRQLTNNSASIINALRRVEANDLYDRDAHEAVYHGLRGALSQVITDPNETNILIHIGDAGNHYRNDPSQVPQSEIVQLLADKKCYYIAFQVHHADQQAYVDFSHQIREIMSRASDRLYQQWTELLGESVVAERPVLRQINRTTHRIENGPPMVVISSEKGRTMDLVDLENEITLAIEEIDKYTDNVVEKAREMLERGQGIDVIAGQTEGAYASSFAPGVYNFLLKMGLDENIIKNYYSKNVQFVKEGYAPTYHQSVSAPLFNSVLLLDAIEFSSIVLRLQKLRQATSTAGDKRHQLYDAWLELLKRHIGVKEDSYYQELTIEQAASMVFGVPLRAGMLQQIQLKDIHDPSVFPDQLLYRYINQINFKYIELELMANTPELPITFKSNDILYYWVDVDLLP